jgi:predicted dehydrogenase
MVELVQLYAPCAWDVREGSHEAPTFEDALRLHQLFDAITVSKNTRAKVAL